MIASIKPIIARLKKAREDKGLNQRALSSKIAIPQSHISKIEAGDVDIKLSSLVEIARNLDLELMLIPREKATLVNNIIENNGDNSSPAYSLDDEE
ncbi:MAG: helix-turn-helix domain-containing protein [Alphaproteobacteria bacterium]